MTRLPKPCGEQAREFEMRATFDGDEGPVEVHIDGDMITIRCDLGIVHLHLSEFDRVSYELAAYRRAMETVENGAAKVA